MSEIQRFAIVADIADIADKAHHKAGRAQPVIATALVMVASSWKRRRPNARSTFVF